MINIDTLKRDYILELLDSASKAYYEGSPIISDEQFDYLSDLIDYNKVGYTLNPDEKKHFKQMYSLVKYYVGEGNVPLREYSGQKIITPKLDGAAISILYIDGNLTQVLTRGNGIVGKDISNKFLFSNKSIIPKKINTLEKVVQVTGEITASKEIENSRNYAAGATNLIDISEFEERELYFTAYDIYPSTNMYRNDLELLQSFRFKTVLDIEWCNKFPQDGIVIRVDDNELFKSLGYTSKYPRGAYAQKVRKEGAITTLLGVEWNTGKSGKVTPTAILEPININGAVVSRATLNNIKFIKSLDLSIGCQVEVVRSGDIIPTVVRKVKNDIDFI